jgi:hypothetical protein
MPFVAVFALLGCGAILGIPSDLEPATDGARMDLEASALDVSAEGHAVMKDAAPDRDAALLPDAPPPSCDLRKDFGTPVLLSSVSTPEPEGSPKLSEDELTIYFTAQRAPQPYYALYMATRQTLTDTFGPAELIPGGVNSPDNHEYAPNVSIDGLSIFFERQDPTTGIDNFFVATRTTTAVPWDTAVPIAGVNVPEYQGKLDVRGDGSELYFVKRGTGTKYHLYVAKRNGGPYVITPLTVLNGPGGAEEFGSAISKDGLVLYFASNRSGTGGTGSDIWVASRAKTTDDFGLPTLVLPVSSQMDEEPNWVSADGCRLYLESDRAGGVGKDIYVATRPL